MQHNRPTNEVIDDYKRIRAAADAFLDASWIGDGREEWSDSQRLLDVAVVGYLKARGDTGGITDEEAQQICRWAAQLFQDMLTLSSFLNEASVPEIIDGRVVAKIPVTDAARKELAQRRRLALRVIRKKRGRK